VDEEEKRRHELQSVIFSFRRGEVDPAFALRGRVLGEGGRNVRRICDETGARVVLEGGGANPQEATASEDSDVILLLRILQRRGTDFDTAVEMARKLFEEVRRDHDQWVARRKARNGHDQWVAHRRPADVRGGPSQGSVRTNRKSDMVQIAKERCLVEASRLREEAGRLVSETGEGDLRAPAAKLLAAGQPSTDAKAGSVAQAAAGLYSSGRAFWRALDEKTKENASAVAEAAAKKRQATMLEQQAQSLRVNDVRNCGGSGVGRMGGFCALFPMGACPFGDCECPRGRHGEPAAPPEDDVLLRITRAKKRLLQQKWADAGGQGELVNAWQVSNPRLEFLYRASECDFAEALGHSSDAIDGWHGSGEENVLSIAMHGFDPRWRSGQVYGAGEYFAKDPMISVAYARGGAFMFLCKLLLGKQDLDHTWVEECKYYVLKQRDCRVQALPLFVVQFRPSQDALAQRLSAIASHDTEQIGALAVRQRGGLQPCEARRDAGMSAPSTRHIWVGWLAPELCRQNDDMVAQDVERFLEGYHVSQVVPERNGARIGAFVLLGKPIDRAGFDELRRCRYHGEFRISVDDQQPANPRCVGKACPRLTGPSHYCRGWNLRGHQAWQWGCPFDHSEGNRATSGASFDLVVVPEKSAKYDEIETELLRSAPFVSADGTTGMPRIVAVRRVRNAALERLYEERRGFLHDKHGFAVEKELWHGTSCKALTELLTHGLQPPSDTRPSEACPRSGGKGLCTTLCGTDCLHCREPHVWDKCHMYGLGVYMADLAQKSHRYVREPTERVAMEATALGFQGWQTVLAGKWRSFEAPFQASFEAARHAGAKYYHFTARGFNYRLDLERLVQINLRTGRERPVRRLDEETEEEREAAADPSSTETRQLVYSMLRCRVCLGNPYLIEGNLLKGDAMHDMCWCQDPGDSLESCAEAWGVAKGHDAYYVRGLAGAHKAGLGVHNSEYVIFQPYQILPLYQVDYVLE